jgi:hypothetical protein
MTLYDGLLGFLAEACDIQRELGVSAEQAHAIQRQRADERLREYERQQAESNVIQFRPRARSEAA